MSIHNITVEGGSSVRLPTAGKYCDRDIIVTATGGGGDPALPSGYVRCGYIRFNAAQIVDTGIICTQDTKIKIVFTRESDTAMYMYGVVNSGNTASVTAYLTSGGAWRFGNRSVSRGLPVNADLVQMAIVNKAGIVSTGGSNAFSSGNFETIGSLLLGSCRQATGAVGVAQYVGKIFLLQMWQGGTEVLHLSPVVSTDGVYRFYDEVSGDFFDSISGIPFKGGNL